MHVPNQSKTLKKLQKGHILTKKDIDFRSPGKGIFEHEISDYLGRELKKEINTGDFL